MLKTRVKTAAVLVLAAAILLYFSYIPLVMQIAAAALGIAAAWELYGACRRPRKSAVFAISVLLAALAPFIPAPGYGLALAVIFPVAAALFLVEARDLTRFTLFGEGTAFAFSLVVTLLFKAFPVLRAGEYGLYYFLLPLVVCVITDTSAYFVGRALGKRKLAPKISPGKSVEGAVGGTAIAVLLTLLLCRAASAAGLVTVRWGAAFLYALTCSLLGQAGDLSLSVLKRITGVKDYGRLMPGHGGVLDRFDSMLFAVSYTLLFLQLSPIFGG